MQLNSLAPLLDNALDAYRQRQRDIAVEEQRLKQCNSMIHYYAAKFCEAFRISAEDLLQEGMIAIVLCSRTYDETKGCFRAYAKPKVRGRMVEFCVANVGPVTRDSRTLRETNFKFYPFDEPAHEDGPTLAEFLPAAEQDIEAPPARYLSKEVCDAIAGTLDNLPPKHRAIVVLKIWGDMSYHEVADILAMQPKSVMETFQRAVKHMRDSDNLLRAEPLQQFDRGCRSKKMFATHKYDAAFKKRTIKEWIASGLPSHVFAERAGVATGTLMIWKRKYYAADPRKKHALSHRQYTAEFKAEIVRRLLAGESGQALAKETGIKYGVFWRWKKDFLAAHPQTDNHQTSLCN